jgi:hypothetical protein
MGTRRSAHGSGERHKVGRIKIEVEKFRRWEWKWEVGIF